MITCWPVFHILVLPQQHKYFRVKGSVLMVLRCSATLALYTVRNFTVLYLFLGKFSLANFDSFLNVFFNSETGDPVLTCCIDKWTGHIPKSWLCNTWNLQSNRSVRLFSIQSDTCSALYCNVIKPVSCLVSHVSLLPPPAPSALLTA